MITALSQRWRDRRGSYRPAGETIPDLAEADRVRFWKRVRRGAPEVCWPWLGSFVKGYGQFTAKRRTLKAHRVAFALGKGSDPAGLCVCHRCDNPRCCNPDHLFLGTNQENTADKVAKGRQVRGPAHRARVRGACLRGNDLAHAKLNPARVRQIRSRAAAGESPTAIARDFGISATAARKVIDRRSWGHVQ